MHNPFPTLRFFFGCDVQRANKLGSSHQLDVGQKISESYSNVLLLVGLQVDEGEHSSDYAWLHGCGSPCLHKWGT